MVAVENTANIAKKPVKDVRSKNKSFHDAAVETKLIKNDVGKPSQDTTSKSLKNGKTLDASTPLDPKESVEKATTLDASTNIDHPIANNKSVAPASVEKEDAFARFYVTKEEIKKKKLQFLASTVNI